MTEPVPEPPPGRRPTDPAQVLTGLLVLFALVATVLIIATAVVWWWRTVIG